LFVASVLFVGSEEKAIVLGRWVNNFAVYQLEVDKGK